jgi:anti-sigma factor RsiW
MTLDCSEVRPHVLDLQQGRLPAALADDIRTHLAGCADCTRLAAVETALDEALDRLPQHPASLALRRRLRAEYAGTTAAGRGPRSRRRLLQWAAGVAVAAALVLAVPMAYDRLALRPDRDAAATLVGEAVNDHVRLLLAQQPLEVKSGGIHQVRPWFAGKLDFAPVVPFGGDDEFPLQGGAVGYFLDRKAAVFVYGHRLHVISLFVFRDDGLRWPQHGLVPIGPVRAYADTVRGFNSLVWHHDALGYALVSDVEPGALRALAQRLAAGG